MEKNFDIVKWRNENPMDYKKAIEFLNEDYNNPEVWKTIHTITKLHIPDKIYKYYALDNNKTLNQMKFDTLEKEKVYLADTKSLNDPFEGKACFYDNNQLLKYERLKAHNGYLIDDFSKGLRITSFTASSIYNMPMWAHYSNNHSGFCVEYNMNNNDLLRAVLFPVQYTEERIDITPIMDKFMKECEDKINYCLKNKIKEIKIDNIILVWISLYYICIKHNSWSYEKELRCVVGESVVKDFYFDAKPSAIYIGLNCSEMNKKHLFDIAYKLNIPIYQMLFDDKTLKYKLEYKKIN